MKTFLVAESKMERGTHRSAGRWAVVSTAAAWLTALGWAAAPVQAQSQSKEVRDHVKHAVVEVFTAISKKKKGDTPFGSGSGFFVNRTGLCITNNHVVDPTHGKTRWEKQRLAYKQLNRLVWKVVVDAGTDDEKTYEAFVLYQNDSADQAILQVYNDDGKFLKTPDYLKLLPGRRVRFEQKLWCYGFPGGDSRRSARDKHPEVAVSEGHVVELPRRPDGDLKMIVTDALVDPGNSGGPMVSIYGYVVGTATLKPPADVAGRANQSALVPADLTRQFINNAFQRGKLESGIDLEPFYTDLVGRDGFVNVPGFPRRAETDCLFFSDGTRVCGAPADQNIVLPTPLGTLRMPSAQMAYLLKQDDEYGIVLMDGGQRLPFLRQEVVINFQPTGGTVQEQDLADLAAVVFRKGGEVPEAQQGRNTLIGGDNYHLLLKNVSGKLKFETEIGIVSRPLEAISSIEMNDDDEQVVQFRDGSQMVGMFLDEPIDAVLAINGAPLRLSFANVRAATVDVVDLEQHHHKEQKLSALLRKAPTTVTDIAHLIDTGKYQEARRRIDGQLNPTVFRRQGTLQKDQLRLLDAMLYWHKGDYASAKARFRKLKRSSDEGIKWYASARLAVLARFPDDVFEGRPLNDDAAFAQAGMQIAHETLRRAKNVLAGRNAPPPETRGAFMRARKQYLELSDDLMVASQLGSDVADIALVWIWGWASDLLLFENQRLQEEMQKKNEEIKELTGVQRDYKGRRLRKEILRLEAEQKQTEKWFRDLRMKTRELGFISDDPDLQVLE